MQASLFNYTGDNLESLNDESGTPYVAKYKHSLSK
jgi:hypothetical protein